MAKMTTVGLRALKQEGKPIVMVTAYDAAQAAFAEQAGIDVVLVGDSLGMVVLGYDTTIPVTLADMTHHAKAVRRGAPQTMMLVDMPFATYRKSLSETVANATLLMQEAFADGVKLEGGQDIVSQVRALTEAGIPVCGHIGLTPQSVLQFGGFRVQGRDEKTARKLLEDAQAIAGAGASMLVLECIPYGLAKMITEQLDIPTIGIGAGSHCSGQVLVFHDLVGMTTKRQPKFVKSYLHLSDEMVNALTAYRDDVRSGAFPTLEQSYESGGDLLERLYGQAGSESAKKADDSR